jgi:hypothetical protein
MRQRLHRLVKEVKEVLIIPNSFSYSWLLEGSTTRKFGIASLIQQITPALEHWCIARGAMSYAMRALDSQSGMSSSILLRQGIVLTWSQQ